MPAPADTSLRRRRRFLQQAFGGAATLGLTATLATPARAQAFPAKPITLVVPFPPGSMFDAVLRPLSEAMTADLGQPVVLLHKPGAGGVTGTAGVAAMTEVRRLHARRDAQLGHPPAAHGQGPLRPAARFHATWPGWRG